MVEAIVSIVLISASDGAGSLSSGIGADLRASMKSMTEEDNKMLLETGAMMGTDREPDAWTGCGHNGTQLWP